MSAEKHIRNPFELALQQLSSAVSDAGDAAVRRRAQAAQAIPEIRRIGVSDLWDSLRKGLEDLGISRAEVPFIGVIYPIAGLVLARFAFNYNLLPLLFPLVAGFALIGPLAAIGLYEISRRREEGREANWIAALGVFRSPALGSILWLGAILLALFGLWLAAAFAIYQGTLGPQPPASFGAFFHEVLFTARGWAMIVSGFTVGFLFAAVTLAISVVSFPLMLDRNVGMGLAVLTSLRAVAANPGPLALWGLIVAGSLALGSAPALLGLIIVMPLLGHASWHLYRKLVA